MSLSDSSVKRSDQVITAHKFRHRDMDYDDSQKPVSVTYVCDNREPQILHVRLMRATCRGGAGQGVQGSGPPSLDQDDPREEEEVREREGVERRKNVGPPVLKTWRRP